MTKEEFLQQVSDWYDNSDNHYDIFVEKFSKDKEGLIELLALVGQSTSTTSVNAAKLFEPKSKEEWMQDMLTPFKAK
jgi:hypothetical protein